MSRAYTPEEVRDKFMQHVRETVKYWATVDGPKTIEDRCSGVAHSILCLIDGVTMLPAFTVSVNPHPDDTQYYIDNQENWFEPGMPITGCSDLRLLHEMLHDDD